MAASDSSRMGDLIPFSPLSAPASIYPATTQAPQENPGTASLASLGGPLPWGCEEPTPGQDNQG